MYSFKEKSRILKELSNPAAAEADISLLRRLAPGDALIASAENSPVRNAEAILFKLLDLTSREEIRLNRREYSENKKEAFPADNSGEKNPETEIAGDQLPEKVQNSLPGEKKSSRKNKNIPASGGKGSAKTKTSK